MRRPDIAGRPVVPTKLLAVGMLVALAGVLAACSPSPAPSPVAAGEASVPVPGSAAPTSPGSPAPSAATAPSSASASPSLAGSPPGAAVVLDESLLAVLPAEVDGVAVGSEAQAFADAAGDPAFAEHVASAVFAIAVDGGDLSSGVIAKLRPDTYTDEFFRDWRDTYDEGACAQAGSVVGNAETELGGRIVHITSCAAGLLVYHAWVPERGVIVSLFSLGERRFGEQLMAGIRP